MRHLVHAALTACVFALSQQASAQTEGAPEIVEIELK
jgi:hypothetical protein